MPRRSTGGVVEKTTSRGTSYALRFRALGKRQFVHVGYAAEGWTRRRLEEMYRGMYESAPFVRLRPEKDWPGTKQVQGSNYCDLAVHLDERTGRIIVLSVIDNLVKGAAGQAVQNLNLRMGWPETAGLEGLPLYP